MTREAWESSPLPPRSAFELPVREPAILFRGPPLPVGAPEVSQTDGTQR
jgi:hypothetical protein